MKRRLPVYILLFVALVSACSGSATTQNNNSAGASAGSQQAKTADNQNRELQKELEQIAAAAKGRVGVQAVVIETGETVSLNPNEHFPMQSVYKFPIGMAVLQQVDAGKLKLEQRVRVEKSDFVREGQRSPVRDKNPQGVELSVGELLRFAVSESDGTASDVLLKLAGGAEAVNGYLKQLEVTDLVVANSEKEIGQDWETQYRNWASPESAVKLLRALYDGRGLSAQSQKLLLKLMTETPTGPKRLKGLLPVGTIVAHKTGTSGANASGINAATNDIGIVTLPNGRHLAIAVFVSDSPANEATREGVIAKVARAVWDKWSK
nr:VEB-PER_beta_lactamase [uncultured bacterium]